MNEPASLPTAPVPPRATPSVLLLAAVLFGLTLALHTRENRFPYTYHPDEGGKVAQVLRGERNYHHPLLLLSATACAVKVLPIDKGPQAVVETGRTVSATFAAGSVVALALLAWWRYGVLIGWIAGIAVALQKDLLELAHYMKEDPALLFGLSLALFAAHVWWRRPGKGSLRFLAIACGLATAGKYLGIVSLAFAVPLVIWHGASDSVLGRGARMKIFAVTFVATFLICNVPIFGWHVSSPFRSIGNEMHGVAGGHQGLTRKVPHAEYLATLIQNVPPVVAGLAAFYALALVVTARRRTPPEWVTLLFPIAYLAMISCSPKTAERYLLPVSVILPLLAALGIGEIVRLINVPNPITRGALRGVAAFILIAVTAHAEWPGFQRIIEGFHHDDPAAVAEWVKTNLPADAVIAEDHRVNLSATKADGVSTDARVPQKVLDKDFAPELGTLDELRAQGVGYVAVCRQNYGRYLDHKTAPQAKVKLSYEQARDFYTRLFAEGKLLKEWPKGTITYLQPGIRLYAIGPQAEKP